MSEETTFRLPKRAKAPTVIQQEAVECGAASLAMILAYHGRIVPLEELREACGVSRDGVKASNMLKAARKYNLEAKGFKATLGVMGKLQTPMIVHWNFNHFLVVEGQRGKKIYLNDPAMGRRVVSAEEFDKAYTGVTLTFKPDDNFQIGGQKRSLVGSLTRRFSGASSLVYVLLAGLLLVIPGLVTPIFSKIFVDSVLIGNMVGWFKPLILGMAAAAVVKTLLVWLMGYYLLRYQTRLAIGESGRYLSQLLQLPQTFFAQRLTGDLVRRVNNNDRVAELLTGKLAQAVISLITVLFYVMLMAYFDALLTLIGVAFAGLNLLLLKLVSENRQEQSVKYMLESGKLYGLGSTGLRLIETLKATGGESDFFSKWAGYHARTINTNQELSRINYLVSIVPPLLNNLSTMAILGFGGLKVMQGQMTMGMLVAFQALMISFMAPFRSLVQLAGNMQEAKGIMTQLDDVAFYRKDPVLRVNADAKHQSRLSGVVSVRDLSFGYSALSAPLIQGFDLTLEPGSRVALVGSSGSGKSTVAKLIAGLYSPWSGEILFDNKPRSAYTRQTFNSSLAVVDQEITLFEGTIRENITMWDETLSDERVMQAAKDASIHSDIVSRPGGYAHLVNEGASNFSGGQRQRLEIARGLAVDPSILVLDEATSALDPFTEERIDDNIRRRGCTCLIVAHRLSTIRDCDEIIVMDRGKIVQRGTHDDLIEVEGLYADLVKTM